jgi:hypothetical protein
MILRFGSQSHDSDPCYYTNVHFCNTGWPEDGRLTVETCSLQEWALLVSKVDKGCADGNS